MNHNYDEAAEQQGQDEAVSWVDGRMLRKDIDDTHTRVVILAKGKCLADYINVYSDDAETETDVSAARSMVGERLTESTLKKAGWKSGKSVRYNTISREIVFL